MSNPNYATINLELDARADIWGNTRTLWTHSETSYDARSGRNKDLMAGMEAYCNIDLSHTHSVSGSTGEMSDPNTAKINFELDDQVKTWPNTRTSWSHTTSTYEASSSRNGNDGQDAYCKINLSHTHSISGKLLSKTFYYYSL